MSPPASCPENPSRSIVPGSSKPWNICSAQRSWDSVRETQWRPSSISPRSSVTRRPFRHPSAVLRWSHIVPLKLFSMRLSRTSWCYEREHIRCNCPNRSRSDVYCCTGINEVGLSNLDPLNNRPSRKYSVYGWIPQARIRRCYTIRK